MIRISTKVLRSIGFLTGLLILMVVLSAIFAPKREIYNATAVDEKQRSLKEEPEDTIDVIFAGDSESYSAFSPLQIWTEYGFTSFVCGTSAQRLCDTYALLQETFETQSPEVVVLETNCLYRFAGIAKETDDKVMAGLSRYLPVFQYHSRWKTYLSGGDSESSESQLKGFRKRKTVKPYLGGEYMNETDAVKEVPELAAEYLEKINTLCKEKNAELVLVSAPSAKCWNYEKHNGVTAWAGKNGVRYLDLNLEDGLGIDWTTDTKDGGDHLNFAGAKKVTQYMGEWLEENWKLMDHRGDSSYDHWYENCGLLD